MLRARLPTNSVSLWSLFLKWWPAEPWITWFLILQSFPRKETENWKLNEKGPNCKKQIRLTQRERRIVSLFKNVKIKYSFYYWKIILKMSLDGVIPVVSVPLEGIFFNSLLICSSYEILIWKRSLQSLKSIEILKI